MLVFHRSVTFVWLTNQWKSICDVISFSIWKDYQRHLSIIFISSAAIPNGRESHYFSSWMPSILNLVQKGPTEFFHIIIIMNGVNLSMVTDYHLNYRQNPTMMGTCYGGNVLGNLTDHCVIVMLSCWTFCIAANYITKCCGNHHQKLDVSWENSPLPLFAEIVSEMLLNLHKRHQQHHQHHHHLLREQFLPILFLRCLSIFINGIITIIIIFVNNFCKDFAGFLMFVDSQQVI